MSWAQQQQTCRTSSKTTNAANELESYPLSDARQGGKQIEPCVAHTYAQARFALWIGVLMSALICMTLNCQQASTLTSSCHLVRTDSMRFESCAAFSPPLKIVSSALMHARLFARSASTFIGLRASFVPILVFSPRFCLTVVHPQAGFDKKHAEN